MKAPHGVVLDLDDTLYLERDYVRSGFAAVARGIAERADADAVAITDFLWRRFLAGERGRHFDHLLQSFPSAAGVVTVHQLIEMYRNHQPQISFLPGIEGLLRRLQKQGRSVAVISDGALASQQAKVAALDLTSYIAGPITLTDTWGREQWKPHQRAFEHVQEALALDAAELVYVGDNPAKDFDAPRALGWTSVRLKVPGQLHYNVHDRLVPDVTARSVAELADTLTYGSRLA